MTEVAEAAGVNKATVSRALKGSSRISRETRQKVWEAAKRLGYQLDTAASGLTSRHTGLIGVMVKDFRVPWLGEFLCGINRVLARYKMEVLLLEAGSFDISLNYALHRLQGRKVDGLIWYGNSPLVFSDIDFPVVDVGGVPRSGKYCVDIDFRDAQERISSLARGRPIQYGGSCGFFPALAALSRPGKGASFVIWDGSGIPFSAHVDLVCGELEVARCLNVPCLCFPAREMGMLAARVLSNAIRDRGVRPQCTLVRPILQMPENYESAETP